jgi:hypothetical protein
MNVIAIYTEQVEVGRNGVIDAAILIQIASLTAIVRNDSNKTLGIFFIP